jgi:hypothetical protein
MKKFEKIFRKPLEMILVEADLITLEDAETVRGVIIESGDLPGNILIDMGVVSENDIVREISRRFQVPYIDLPNYHVTKAAIELVNRKFLHKYQVFPLDQFGDTLAVTMSQCLSVDGLRELQAQTPLELTFYVSKISDVKKALEANLPYDKKVVEEERRKKAVAAQPNTWTDIFDTANKNVMKGLTKKQDHPFKKP